MDAALSSKLFFPKAQGMTICYVCQGSRFTNINNEFYIFFMFMYIFILTFLEINLAFKQTQPLNQVGFCSVNTYLWNIQYFLVLWCSLIKILNTSCAVRKFLTPQHNPPPWVADGEQAAKCECQLPKYGKQIRIGPPV